MENVVALIAATIVLILIPGPNAALIVANSLQYGFRAGLTTALGTTAGISLQLASVVIGMAALVEAAASALFWIKWLGVAYLFYLGVKSWRERPADLGDIRAQSHSRIFLRAVLLALANPKTLLFNAAFLPQFVGGSGDITVQLLLLAAVFLSVVVVGDALWAVFAASARRWLSRYGKLRNKLTGGFLVGAGLGLAFSRKGV